MLKVVMAAMASTTVMPPLTTSPNTVNPPFCTSRFALLFARLMYHWLVALLTLPESFAIAIVPRRFDSSGSLVMAAFSVTDENGDVYQLQLQAGDLLWWLDSVMLES